MPQVWKVELIILVLNVAPLKTYFFDGGVVLYKIVIKVVANRLEKYLPS